MHAYVNADSSLHELQVRSLLVCKLGLLTGSRDKTFKLWRKGANGYEIENTYVGHESYVTALQYIPAGLLPGLPDGAIVSGKSGFMALLGCMRVQHEPWTTPLHRTAFLR